MQLVVFGLSVSSAAGSSHAMLWRGLIEALTARGHQVTFYEQDTPYRAAHRDYPELPDGELVQYKTFEDIRANALSALKKADAGIVTSACPDALAASALLLGSAVPIRAFYDFDTALTLNTLAHGEAVPYLGARGLSDFDIVLSYTGGPALEELSRVLGARNVVPLFGGVDPHLYAPAQPIARFRADLSYLGAYAADRQMALEQLLLAPARAREDLTFAIGGSQYPSDFARTSNVKYLWHVPPHEHPAMFCSARLSLHVTRAPAAAMGFCPSDQLFQAAACGAALISDAWPGISQFYEPRDELIVGRDTRDVLNALTLSDSELASMGKRARERTLAQHTLDIRARQLIDHLCDAHASSREFERESVEPIRTV
jgi:spore maturation protein CgeB